MLRVGGKEAWSTWMCWKDGEGEEANGGEEFEWEGWKADEGLFGGTGFGGGTMYAVSPVVAGVGGIDLGLRRGSVPTLGLSGSPSSPSSSPLHKRVAGNVMDAISGRARSKSVVTITPHQRSQAASPEPPLPSATPTPAPTSPSSSVSMSPERGGTRTRSSTVTGPTNSGWPREALAGVAAPPVPPLPKQHSSGRSQIPIRSSNSALASTSTATLKRVSPGTTTPVSPDSAQEITFRQRRSSGSDDSDISLNSALKSPPPPPSPHPSSRSRPRPKMSDTHSHSGSSSSGSHVLAGLTALSSAAGGMTFAEAITSGPSPVARSFATGPISEKSTKDRKERRPPGGSR